MLQKVHGVTKFIFLPSLKYFSFFSLSSLFSFSRKAVFRMCGHYSTFLKNFLFLPFPLNAHKGMSFSFSRVQPSLSFSKVFLFLSLSIKTTCECMRWWSPCNGFCVFSLNNSCHFWMGWYSLLMGLFCCLLLMCKFILFFYATCKLMYLTCSFNCHSYCSKW